MNWRWSPVVELKKILPASWAVRRPKESDLYHVVSLI